MNFENMGAETIAPIMAAFPDRVLSFGADNRWVQPDSAFIVEVDSHELRFQVNDFSIAHHAYLPVPLPAVAPAPNGTQAARCSPQNAISFMYLDVIGVGFTGMPSTACKLLLHGLRGGTITTVSDPSADVTALNTRHLISTDFGGTPHLLDYQEDYMVEVQSPVSGSGASRHFDLYRVVFYITPSVIDPSAGGGGRVYASKMPL